MLIEEDVLMAEKRRISEVSSSETTPQTRAKRAPRVTRSGIVYSNATAGSRIIQGIDTQRNEASSSHVALGNASNSQLIELPAIRKINVSLKQPIHPLLPIGQPGEKAWTINDVEQIVDRIVNETVIRMSFSDVAALSPVARSKIKQTLTKKPQANRRVREKKPLNNQSQVLIGETSLTTAKGKSAPRGAYGSMNGKPWELILDGGCTSYIVNLNILIRTLGITEVERTSASVMFGDG